jgi:calcineurin-like phosphoesterase family protein/2'-5' RNA ligase
MRTLKRRRQKSFFIEVRLLPGYAKYYAKDLTEDIARKFKVKGAIAVKGAGRWGAIPHIALYGESQTDDIGKIVSEVERIGQKYSPTPFRIKGFDYFDKEHKVIYLDVEPSPELEWLRWELAQSLSKISTHKPWDKERKFEFHLTIAFKDIDKKFNKIWDYVKSIEEPNINQYLLRITILGRNRRILYEYDLVLKRLLNRREALSKHLWRKTVNRLREMQGQPLERRLSLWQKLINWMQGLSGKKDIYLIGDMHFDHSNIIKYCQRPFQSVEEMNRTLVTKWNALVTPRDTVYFMGDWSFGRGSRPPKYWRSKLNGHIVSIRGSHDNRVKGIKFANHTILYYGRHDFLLIHDPDRKPEDWHGWIIHGHKHNNDMRDYPFINGERKTINVAVELIGYQPLNIDKLLSLDIGSIRRMETINSQPERW